MQALQEVLSPLERAKLLASAWISHGLGVAAVSQKQWDDMEARAQEALKKKPGLPRRGRFSRPRDILREEAHDAAQIMNNMVGNDKYDESQLDYFQTRLDFVKAEIQRYWPHFSEAARNAYVQRKEFTEGVMKRLDSRITGGASWVKGLPSELAKEIGRTAGEISEAIGDPLGALAKNLGIPKALVVGGVVIGGALVLITVLK